MRYRLAMEMSEPIRKIRARKSELRSRRLLFFFLALVEGEAALNGVSLNGLAALTHSPFRTFMFILCGLASIGVFLTATIFWKPYVRRLNRKAEVFLSEAGDSELFPRTAR
jgi:hypothetical protein